MDDSTKEEFKMTVIELYEECNAKVGTCNCYDWDNEKEDKPYYVIINPKGLHSVMIDRRIVTDNESQTMRNKFENDGFKVIAITVNEYEKIKSKEDFHPI